MAEIKQKPKRKAGMGEPPKSSDPKPKNLQKPASSELVALNFSVDPEFRKEFRIYSAEHDINHINLLKEMFAFYKKHHP